MEKQDKYRFNLAFDETDEDHLKFSRKMYIMGKIKPITLPFSDI